MLNMLKMNLFRMKKNRSAYVMLGVSALIQCLLIFISWLEQSTIQGLLEIPIDIHAPHNVFTDLMMQGTIPGIMMISLLFSMLFFSSEYSSGYLKNLIGYQGNKFALAGSNLVTVAIYTFAVTVVNVAVTILLAVLCYEKVSFANAGKDIGYIVIIYLESVAYTMLFVAWSDRNGKHVLKMILGALYTMYAMIFYLLINLAVQKMFDIEVFHIEKYTLLGGLSSLPAGSEAKDFIILGAIALLVLEAAYLLDVLALKKRELK